MHQTYKSIATSHNCSWSRSPLHWMQIWKFCPLVCECSEISTVIWRGRTECLRSICGAWRMFSKRLGGVPNGARLNATAVLGFNSTVPGEHAQPFATRYSPTTWRKRGLSFGAGQGELHASTKVKDPERCTVLCSSLERGYRWLMS